MDQFDEFLAHNELALAFDALASVAQQAECESLRVLELLALAATNMGLLEKQKALDERISGLRGAKQQAPRNSSSLKPLKSVAHNVCAQFGSTLVYWGNDYGINHLARAALAAGGTVEVDLLACTSHPNLAGEGMEAIRELSLALPAILAGEGFALEVLASATATYRFHGPEPERGGCATYDCRVELATAGGRLYFAELSDGSIP